MYLREGGFYWHFDAARLYVGRYCLERIQEGRLYFNSGLELEDGGNVFATQSEAIWAKVQHIKGLYFQAINEYMTALRGQ